MIDVPDVEGRRRDGSPVLAVTLAVVVALCLLALTPWTTLWDRDETVYARVAVEGLQGGHVWLPTFRGQPLVGKPPLLFLLMSTSVRAFGVSEFAVRCWSPIALAWTALAVYVLARHLGSHETGMFAMAMFVLNPMSWLQGLAATTDALLVGGITTALVSGVIGLDSGFTVTRLLLVVAGCAAGALAKGPLAVGIVLIVLAPVAWAHRPRGRWPAIAVGLAACIGALPFAVWFAWADARTGGALWPEFYLDYWHRSTEPNLGHGGSRWVGLPYYLLTVCLGFAPWVAWLGVGIRRLRQGGKRLAMLVLASWGLAPLALFSLAATRLPHYAFPVWPALAVVAAIGAASERRREGPATRDALLQWLQPVLGTGFAAALFVSSALVPVAAARAGLALAGLVAAGGTIWTWQAVRGLDPATAALRALVPTSLVLALLAGWVAPTLEPLKVSSNAARAVLDRVGPSVPVAVVGFAEAGLDFYLGQAVEVLSREQIDAWSVRPGLGVLLLAEQADPARPGMSPRVREVGRVAGFDQTKGRYVDLRVLEREPR